MKALSIYISFFEAHFKVHYTRKFKLSYPIPLPTTVAGIFGAILGIDRDEISKYFSNFYFGAGLNNEYVDSYDTATFIQFPWDKKTWPPGVEKIQIINEPEYIICIAGKDSDIKDIFTRINNGLKFLPYGGQNDFFIKDIKIGKIEKVEMSDTIENYAPKSIVKDILITNNKKTFLNLLPVMHKFTDDSAPFYFVSGAKLKLTQKLLSSFGLGLYEFSKFYYPKG